MNVYLSFSKLDFAKDDELEHDERETDTGYRPVYLKREEFTFFHDKFTLYDAYILAKQAAEYEKEAENVPTETNWYDIQLVTKRNGRIFQEGLRVTGTTGEPMGLFTFQHGLEKITGYMNRMFELVDEEAR
jgi:hypothetical protein